MREVNSEQILLEPFSVAYKGCSRLIQVLKFSILDSITHVLSQNKETVHWVK